MNNTEPLEIASGVIISCGNCKKMEVLQNGDHECLDLCKKIGDENTNPSDVLECDGEKWLSNSEDFKSTGILIPSNYDISDEELENA